MFRRKVLPLSDALNTLMRDSGLESPLLQKRMVDGWDDVAGPIVAKYTKDKFIKNQTLFVKIVSPAMRSELAMHRSELVQKLNNYVGSFVISDIRIY